MTRSRLSVSTLVETSTLLAGATLEDRAYLRDNLDLDLLPAEVRNGIPCPVEGRPAFFYGCVDILAFSRDGATTFQVLEFNGTGMGGLTNLPTAIMEQVLDELAGVAAFVDHDSPVIVAPLSIETKKGLIHERLLVAQALTEGLQSRFGMGRLHLLSRTATLPPDLPAVVTGHPSEFRAALSANNGRVHVAGRDVDVVMRDLFCQHLHDRMRGQLADDAFFAINQIFRVCASKLRTYELYDNYLARFPNELLSPTRHRSAMSRAELCAIVGDELANGQAVVIKPHAGGAGRGIEFFHPTMTRQTIETLVDAALVDAMGVSGQTSRELYPYVVCELLDGLTIEHPDHRWSGHRFELRIMVYRIGSRLHALPVSAKVAGKRFSAGVASRSMLLNTVSADSPGDGGFLLPLCNAETLDALGLDVGVLSSLTDFAARFVRHVVSRNASVG